MSLIASLFGRSPVRPMQEHMRAAVRTAQAIPRLVEAMAARDAAAIQASREEIDALEHEADRIKNEIRSHLPARMMLAAQRRDLLDILDAQDSIADTAQDIAELVDQRAMSLPDGLRDVIGELAHAVVATCEQAQRVVDELDELVATGFRGREATRVKDMIDELSRIETKSDRLQERAVRQVFQLEGELGVSAYFWWYLIDWIADLADYAERVGNRLRLLVAG